MVSRLPLEEITKCRFEEVVVVIYEYTDKTGRQGCGYQRTCCKAVHHIFTNCGGGATKPLVKQVKKGEETRTAPEEEERVKDKRLPVIAREKAAPGASGPTHRTGHSKKCVERTPQRRQNPAERKSAGDQDHKGQGQVATP